MGSDLSRPLYQWNDPDGVMRRISRGAVNLVAAAEGVSVDLVDSDGNLVPVCTEGIVDWPRGRRLGRNASLAGLTMSSRSPLRCDDTELDPRVDLDACRTANARSLVCVPLVRGAVPVGVFTVTASKPYAFDDDVVETLSELAGFISAVVGTVVRSTDPFERERPATAATTSRPAVARRNHADDCAVALLDRPPTDADRVAAFVTDVILPEKADVAAARAHVERMIETRALTMAFQPVVKLARRTTVGVEALARFPGPPQQTPDAWFAQAYAVGLGIDLELLAIEEALLALRHLPPNVVLAVNASPTAVASPELHRLLSAVDATRVVVEITEHAAVDDYVLLGHRIAALRALGARISIDDTGSGYASFRHILSLSPDYIKLDLALTRNIDRDPARRALAVALVGFVSESGARLIAEGIETADEMATVRQLGIEFGQGYHLGRPVPFDALDLPGLRR